jgi:hypothetical protein
VIFSQRRRRAVGGAFFAVAGALALVLGVDARSQAAAADQGSAFAGRYALSDVDQNGGEAFLTLTISVRNDGGAAALSARIVLAHPDAPDDREDLDLDRDWTYGAFVPIDIFAGQTVRVTGRFVIAATEYQRWTSGYDPRVWISFHDESGAWHRVDLELREAPEIPVPQP